MQSQLTISILTYSIWYALYEDPMTAVCMWRPVLNPTHTMFKE